MGYIEAPQCWLHKPETGKSNGAVVVIFPSGRYAPSLSLAALFSIANTSNPSTPGIHPTNAENFFSVSSQSAAQLQNLLKIEPPP